MHFVMANEGGNRSSVLREYRKGNWTLQETMVLIEAKKMDDERRLMKSSTSSSTNKPTELRWKCVEDYCWRNGCLRSQNQCNDKWDNLMRDFKKVRDYESRIGEGAKGYYWNIEKSERKEKNLPTNMLPQVYEALVGVVERKVGGGGQRVVVGGGGGSSSYDVQPPLLQHSMSAPVAILPPPPPKEPPPPAQQSLPYSQPFPAVDSDSSEYSDSPTKRRRRGGEGTSGNASGNTSTNDLGTAISKSASIIAEAIQACEEREERRHRDLISLQERRLKIEESKNEINRQGINGLVGAINNLAKSIFALAPPKNQPTTDHHRPN